MSLILVIGTTCLLWAETVRSTTYRNRSSRWWFHLEKGEVFREQAMDLVKMHRESLTGIFTYYNVSLEDDGHVMCPNATRLSETVKPFKDMGLTVGVAFSAISQSSIMNITWTADTLKELAAFAKAAEVDSLMIDYEPRTNITNLHAEQYALFVRMLATYMHDEGLELEMCVSSWSILTSFEYVPRFSRIANSSIRRCENAARTLTTSNSNDSVYADTGVDGMMSMASTYFGTNVTSDEGWVEKERTEGVSREQLRVGIGTTNSIVEKWDYNWTQPRFESFVTFLEEKDVRSIDLWRTDIDATNATNATATWMVSGLQHFLSGETPA